MKKILLLTIIELVFYVVYCQTPKIWGVSHLRGIGGNGSIYEYNPDAETLEDVISFDSAGLYRPSTVICFSKGNVYGIARKKSDTAFVIYSVDVTSKIVNVLHTLQPSQGGFPFSALEMSNDILYGICGSGGANNLGTLFSFSLAGNSFTKLHDFNGSKGLMGGDINGTRVAVVNDVIYHFQYFGNCTKLWKYSLSQNTFSYIFQLDSTNFGKEAPSTNLENINNDFLIACTWGSVSGVKGGGQTAGNVYKIDLKTDEVTMVITAWNNRVGAGMEGELEYSWVDGRIYGVSRVGGGSNGVPWGASTGSVFAIDVPYFSSAEVLYSIPDFDDGAYPYSGVLLASNNILYNFFSISNYIGFLGVTKNGQLHNIKKFWNADVPATYLVQVDGLKTGIYENGFENSFEVFPNPAHEKLYFRQKEGGNFSALLFTSDGKIVRQVTIEKQVGSLNVTELSKGVYFLKLIDNNSKQMLYEKILIQ